MQHVFVSHLDAATNPDAATAFHAAHESHATLLVLGTHVRHELLGNVEVFPGLLGMSLGDLLVGTSLLDSMLGCFPQLFAIQCTSLGCVGTSLLDKIVGTSFTVF